MNNNQIASNSDMQRCIEACKQCHDICFQMATTHCLQMGGQHVEPEHLRLMLNCAEMCQTAANFMLSKSSLHIEVCGVCAEVCNACAQSCEQVGDMEECVQACRQCEKTCEEMANSHLGNNRGQALKNNDQAASRDQI